jgi:cysteine desulfurase
VLKAMGYGDDLAAQAIRISIGPGIGREDVLRFADNWGREMKRIASRVA